MTNDYDCICRGEVLYTVDTSGCACRSPITDVLRCELHGECTVYRVRDTRGRRWKACRSCEQRVLPDSLPGIVAASQ